ncbi:nitrogen regulation protein NR(I) [Desulfobaculum xiamenense]|uniref:DNA-binding transcriptional regulator NtrC n=1 Tax=Desulfobaculum xiamenense TaxID=995050 RepID=A0A846QTN1_9BACT|nr:nitrogen regulation protein NR(I) [Desulfobaculum xiamenense]
MASILIVDDDAQLRQSFGRLLAQEGHDVRTAPSAEAGVEIVREDCPDLVIMDVRLPGMTGLEGFQVMHRYEPKLPVIVMTAFGTTETAIEATKLGAFDYVLKPFDIPDILTLIEQALDAGRFMRSRVDVDAAPESEASDALVGRSPAMQEVYKAIGRVSPTDATVLVRGESGTGKELVARSVYQHSLRTDKPFIVINCVAIPETLLESELFGYEKGAFTGAVSRRVGKIEQADGGTIFLDEIGDMPFSIQAKLLRLLEEKSVERLGGGMARPVDVRIIAATNRDLEAAVSEGRFREDLYYRLKVVTLWLPPLRERAGDVPLLAEHFLTRYARRMGSASPGFTDEARKVLDMHHWPGNVRELANAVQKATIFSRGCPITRENAHQAIHGERAVVPARGDSVDDVAARWMRRFLSGGDSERAFEDILDHFGAIAVTEALRLTGGNRVQAAKLLGMSRPTLLARIERYGIHVDAIVSQQK